MLECNLGPQCGMGRGRSSVGDEHSLLLEPSWAVEAAIDYAACLVRFTGPKALAARGNMSICER